MLGTVRVRVKVRVRREEVLGRRGAGERGVWLFLSQGLMMERRTV